MTTLRSTLLAFALAGATFAVALVVSPSAFGKDDREVVKTGRCTQGSTWKLELDAEHGRIETELEIDEGRAGVRWQIVLRQRGKVVFRGARTTRGPDGELELHRRLPNRPGPDTITARATRASGEVCRARATLR